MDQQIVFHRTRHPFDFVMVVVVVVVSGFVVELMGMEKLMAKMKKTETWKQPYS